MAPSSFCIISTTYGCLLLILDRGETIKESTFNENDYPDVGYSSNSTEDCFFCQKAFQVTAGIEFCDLQIGTVPTTEMHFKIDNSSSPRRGFGNTKLDIPLLLDLP